MFSRLSNPSILQWMNDNEVSSVIDLHTYYAERILKIMRTFNATPIVWQDIWDEKVQVNIQ